MEPMRRMTVEHFTHPGHPLTYISSNTQFICDGCKILGTGNRYRCGTCDFDLHEYCCTCPTSLVSFMHPMHQLTLDFMKPQGQRDMERVCNVCSMFVNGLFYRCRVCNFYVHHLCAHRPQHTRHPLHAHHVLRLQPVPSGPSSSGWCMVCKTTSWEAWGYKCELCDFGVHLKCFNSAPAAPVYAHSNSGSGIGSGSRSVLSFASSATSLVNTYHNISSGGGVHDFFSEIVNFFSN